MRLFEPAGPQTLATPTHMTYQYVMSTENASEAVRSLLVKQVRYEAPGILSFTLIHPDGALLPPASAGAHIDVTLGRDLVRSYSLINPGETHRYVIAVQESPDSRGGSRALHRDVRPGDLLSVSPMRNLFALDADAPHSVLIAGGIGITPILAMAQELAAAGRSWDLYYGARNQDVVAFLPEIGDIPNGRFHLHLDNVAGGPVDIPAIVSAAPESAHFYCCGPNPMLDAFEEATSHLPVERIHLERFIARSIALPEHGYRVTLARSGTEIEVLPGRSLLETLLDAGIDAPFSCMSGICGSCEIRVLEGRPDHRDDVLTERQRATNEVMMICCSGSLDERLVLDL